MNLDFLSNEINIGDTVVFNQLKYRNMMKGTVIKITPKQLIIEHPPTNIGNTTSKQSHDQVIVIKSDHNGNNNNGWHLVPVSFV